MGVQLVLVVLERDSTVKVFMAKFIPSNQGQPDEEADSWPAQDPEDRAEARRQYGFPPRRDDFVDEVMEPTDDCPLYEIGISEGAEYYLGTSVFMRLPEYFMKVVGVTELSWEDREIFRFRTQRTDLSQLREDFYTCFVAAANDTFSQLG
jgi:hypothetical protein